MSSPDRELHSLASARTASVIYEGRVSKRGNIMRNWRTRYFVLWRDGPTLQYWKKSSANNRWRLKGVIPLRDVLSCTRLPAAPQPDPRSTFKHVVQ
jgi:hypothetical protein